MLHAVRRNLVAGVGDAANDLGLMLRHPAEDKEGRRCLMVGQDLEDAIDRRSQAFLRLRPVGPAEAGPGSRLDLEVFFDVETEQMHHVPTTLRGTTALAASAHS